ncbi:MAG: ABC transporter substrate-binding protein [Planctomycetota bacterium]|jgi:nickel transport system substrate-binding protein
MRLLAISLLACLISVASADGRALRIGVAARAGPHSLLTPLVYWGGFQTKTAVYEGLVRYGVDGELQPALATKWERSPDGTVYTLTLRRGVRLHDGTELDARAVVDHLVRWRGNPGNRWLGSTARMERIEALDRSRVRVVLSKPWPFLEECAGGINPAFIVGPGAYSHEGSFRAAVGSGPYRLVDQRANEVYAFEAHAGWWGGAPAIPRIEMLVAKSDPVAMLRRGEIDLAADGSGPIIDRDALRALADDPAYHVSSGPGSATTLLVFNTARGPFAGIALRRRCAAAIDRAELVEKGEQGWAEAATTLFSPGRAGWPRERRGQAAGAAAGAAGRDVPAVLLLGSAPSRRIARHLGLLESQLARAGVRMRVETAADRADYVRRLRAGAYDLLLKSTYGAPYDPYITLQTLFLERPSGTASSSPPVWNDTGLRGLLHEAFAAPAEQRRAFFARMQARLDDEVPLVPLFRSKRVAVSAAWVRGVRVGIDGYDLGLASVKAGELPRRPSLLAVPEAAAPAAQALAPVAEAVTDPRKGEVRLDGAAPDWRAFLMLDNKGVGVWTVKPFQVFANLGCPEVVGLDDKGVCHVMVSYSGKWTPIDTVNDGKWLGGLAHGDIDPRIDGAELYTGSQRGNIYQVVAHPHRAIDNRLIAHLPGLEIHTILAGELDPRNETRELLVFTRPGALYRLTPTGAHGRFEIAKIADVPDRVRDAIVLPGGAGLATVSRGGRLRQLSIERSGPRWTTIHAAPMGKGRVTLRPAAQGRRLTLYTTQDDGCILRHERTAKDAWKTETIYCGPQGPRGLVAGRFHADPDVESVAVFGYSRKVQLLSRRADGWKVETIFTDTDKGHWLAAAEVDGRNATLEIVASGFGGRITLLARPPGYGLGVATEEDAP